MPFVQPTSSQQVASAAQGLVTALKQANEFVMDSWALSSRSEFVVVSGTPSALADWKGNDVALSLSDVRGKRRANGAVVALPVEDWPAPLPSGSALTDQLEWDIENLRAVDRALLDLPDQSEVVAPVELAVNRLRSALRNAPDELRLFGERLAPADGRPAYLAELAACGAAHAAFEPLPAVCADTFENYYHDLICGTATPNELDDGEADIFQVASAIGTKLMDFPGHPELTQTLMGVIHQSSALAARASSRIATAKVGMRFSALTL